MEQKTLPAPAAAEALAETAQTRFGERRARTRRSLLDSARQVLARRGFHGTKIADVVRQAGVAVGTFYLYYPTKEALFLEVVQDTARRLKEEVDRVESSIADPHARTKAGCETFFRFAHENRELFRIVFGHGSTFHGAVRQAQQLFVANLAANLRAGIEAGAFRSNNPDIVAHAFIGTLIEALSWWIDQEDISIQEITQSVLDFVFHGLSTGSSGAIPTPHA